MNALASVPGCVVVAATVDIVGTAVALTLTEVLNPTKLVSGNGFNVLNNLLDNNSLGVVVLNTLMVDRLRSTVE